MAFEFLRLGKVYLEDALSPSTFYRLHVGQDFGFSQTFKQEGIPQKTLHSQTSLFEGSRIHSYNPVDVNFTLLMVDEVSKYQHVPLDFLINYDGNALRAFNLYFLNESVSPEVQYKLSNCVFTNGVFNIPRAGLMTVSLTAQGTQLTRTTGSFTLASPGYVESNALSFGVSREVSVSVNSVALDNILGVSLELQNNIEWIEKATIHATQNAVSPGTSIYPSNYVLNSRTLAGSIQQYIDQGRTQSYTNVLTWRENIPISIKAGLSSTNYQLEVNMTGCSFTNRPVTGEIFSQSYDFRLMSNPASLGSFFIY